MASIVKCLCPQRQPYSLEKYDESVSSDPFEARLQQVEFSQKSPMEDGFFQGFRTGYKQGFRTGYKYDRRYDLDHLIGSGAFANVYRVKHNGELFAVKIFNPREDGVSPDEYKNRLVRESHIHQSLAPHPNIIFLHTTIKIQKTTATFYGMVMEYHEESKALVQAADDFFLHSGMSFHEAEKREERIRTLAKDVFSGLEYLHNSSLVHRDLSVSNILLYPGHSGHLDIPKGEFVAKIADFGHSRDIRTKSGLPLKEAGEDDIGLERPLTPRGAYERSSLELLEGKATNAYACDMYSMGVMLFEISEGKNFLPLDAPIKVKMAIKQSPLKFSRRFPKNLSDLIKRLMQKDPEKRPSIQEAKAHKFFNRNN